VPFLRWSIDTKIRPKFKKIRGISFSTLFFKYVAKNNKNNNNNKLRKNYIYNFIFEEEIQDKVFSFSFLVFIVLLLRGTSQVDCGKLFCRLPEAISSSLFSGWLAIYFYFLFFKKI